MDTDISAFFWKFVDLVLTISFEDLAKSPEFISLHQIVKKDEGLKINRQEIAIDIDTANIIDIRGVIFDSHKDLFWFANIDVVFDALNEIYTTTNDIKRQFLIHKCMNIINHTIDLHETMETFDDFTI